MLRSLAYIDYSGHVHCAHSTKRCVLECALLGVVRVILLIFGQMQDARRRVRPVLLETDRDNTNNSQQQSVLWSADAEELRRRVSQSRKPSERGRSERRDGASVRNLQRHYGP